MGSEMCIRDRRFGYAIIDSVQQLGVRADGVGFREGEKKINLRRRGKLRCRGKAPVPVVMALREGMGRFEQKGVSPGIFFRAIRMVGVDQVGHYVLPILDQFLLGPPVVVRDPQE